MSAERIAKLQQEIAELDQALIVVGSLPAAAEPLRQQRATKQAELDALADVRRVEQRIELGDGSAASGNEQTYVAPGGTYNKYAAPNDPTLAREEQALRDYLRAAHGDCRVLQLGALDEGDARNSASMGLDNVYVGLHTERQIEVVPEPKNGLVTPRRRSLLDRALGWVNAALGREAIDEPEHAQPGRSMRSRPDATRCLRG